MKQFHLVTILLLLISCQTQGNNNNSSQVVEKITEDYSGLDTATFAGGCFWCVEASFDQINGVAEAVSGYAGGEKSDATYELVSSGQTKHAETVQIYFDPEVIDYETLLEIFFTAHDPTQVNRQGPDVGYQYRTAIFYHNDSQKAMAEAKIIEIQSQYSNPIATELTPYSKFYLAEEYHQNYEVNHPYNPYIVNVSRPKIERVRKKFADRLKED